jgi:hypothetical protein
MKRPEPYPKRHYGKTAILEKPSPKPKARLKTDRQIGFRTPVEKEGKASVLCVNPGIHRRFGDGRNGMTDSRSCQGAQEFFDFLIVLIGQPFQALGEISVIAPVWHVPFLLEGARASDRFLIKANSTLRD